MKTQQETDETTFIIRTSFKFTGVLVVAFTPFMSYYIGAVQFEEAILLALAFVVFLLGLLACRLLSVSPCGS